MQTTAQRYVIIWVWHLSQQEPRLPFVTKIYHITYSCFPSHLSLMFSTFISPSLAFAKEGVWSNLLYVALGEVQQKQHRIWFDLSMTFRLFCGKHYKQFLNKTIFWMLRLSLLRTVGIRGNKNFRLWLNELHVNEFTVKWLVVSKWVAECIKGLEMYSPNKSLFEFIFGLKLCLCQSDFWNSFLGHRRHSGHK